MFQLFIGWNIIRLDFQVCGSVKQKSASPLAII